jgi:hypothetical protein
MTSSARASTPDGKNNPSEVQEDCVVVCGIPPPSPARGEGVCLPYHTKFRSLSLPGMATSELSGALWVHYILV